MVYVILSLLVLLASCTDYVAQSEDLTESNEEQFEFAADSLSSLLEKVGLEIPLKLIYKDSLLGGDLVKIRISTEKLNLLQKHPLYLWGIDSSGWQVLDSLSWGDTLEYDYESPLNLPTNPLMGFKLALNKKKEPTYSVVSFIPDSLWYSDIYAINTLANATYTSQENVNLFKAFSQNMKNAETHINLALGGSHETHLKHVYHYLSGIKGTRKEWWQSDPIALADSVGAIEQLDGFIELLNQLRLQTELDSTKKANALAIQSVLTKFRESIFSLLDQIPDLVTADASDIVDPLNTVLLNWKNFTDGQAGWPGFKNWYEMSGQLLEFNLSP